jgi:uncharacterized protein (DUF433 family)
MTATAPMVFSPAEVQEVTGASRRQLDYWSNKGLFRSAIDRRVGRRRLSLLSFEDLFEARLTSVLRARGASLQEIGRVLAHLRGLGYPRPLLQVPMRVVDGHVEFTESTLTRSGRKPEQGILNDIVPAVTWDELRANVERLRRAHRRVGEIERRRGVLGYQPVLAGTRIPTSAIWNVYHQGINTHGIRDQYPQLEIADVEAALDYERRRRSHGAPA